MNISENSEEIAVQHTPLKKWILGGSLCLIFGGLLVWFVLSIFFRTRLSFAFDVVLASDFLTFLFLFTVSATFLFFLSLLSAPQMNVIISRKTKSVDIIRRRMYGTRCERYFFYQIRKFKSYKGMTRFSLPYYLALIRVNGKIIKLKIPTGEKNTTIKLVKKLNKFLKQSPKDELAEQVISDNLY